MKNLLFRRFICAALLVASSATAGGVRFSEWQGVAPLQSFSPSSPNLSPALTNAERGLFQQGFVEGGVAAALLNPAVWAIVAVGAAVAVSAKIRSNRKSSAPTSPPLPVAQQTCVDAVAMNDLSSQNRVFTEPTGTFRFFGSTVDVALTTAVRRWGTLVNESPPTGLWIAGSSTDPGNANQPFLVDPQTNLLFLTAGTTINLMSSAHTGSAVALNAGTFRAYADSMGTIFIADGEENVATGTTETSRCVLMADEFFLDANNVRTTDYATGNQFRERLRGVINESRAVRLGDFYFAADAQLSNIQLERRDALWLSEGFDLYSDSGYQRIGAEKTAVFYNKLTALQKLSETAEGYLQLSSGSVTSDKYRDSRLQGLALGIIAERVFRHDDTLHFRLERPTGDSRAKSWYAAANMQIGNAAAHWNFGIRQRLDKGTAEGSITYRREF